MGSLSVENSTWPQNPFHMPLDEAARVGEEFGEGPWLGILQRATPDLC